MEHDNSNNNNNNNNNNSNNNKWPKYTLTQKKSMHYINSWIKHETNRGRGKLQWNHLIDVETTVKNTFTQHQGLLIKHREWSQVGYEDKQERKKKYKKYHTKLHNKKI